MHLPFGLPGFDVHMPRDFAHFYVQGVIANDHNSRALYNIEAHEAILRRVVPGSPTMRFPPVHGPQVALLFAPLAWLSYAAALRLWLTLTVVGYLACGYAVWRACPNLRDRRGTALLLLLAAPALRFDLGFAQTSVIGLACVTAGYLALRSGRPFLAGLAIGSLVYKPQLALAACIFLFAGEWTLVAGAIVAAAVQLVIGGLYWGFAIFPAYVRALGQIPQVVSGMEGLKFDMHSWRSFFELLPLPPAVALTAYGAASTITLVVAFLAWRSKGPLEVRYAVFLIATILVDPHMWVYDFLLLTPAFLLLWDWVRGQDTGLVGDVWPRVRPAAAGRWAVDDVFEWLLYFCYFSPLFGIVADATRVQPSIPALATLGAMALTLVRSSITPIPALVPKVSQDGVA